jgi:hypothetical protein
MSRDALFSETTSPFEVSCRSNTTAQTHIILPDEKEVPCQKQPE